MIPSLCSALMTYRYVYRAIRLYLLRTLACVMPSMSSSMRSRTPRHTNLIVSQLVAAVAEGADGAGDADGANPCVGGGWKLGGGWVGGAVGGVGGGRPRAASASSRAARTLCASVSMRSPTLKRARRS